MPKDAGRMTNSVDALGEVRSGSALCAKICLSHYLEFICRALDKREYLMTFFLFLIGIIC